MADSEGFVVLRFTADARVSGVPSQRMLNRWARELEDCLQAAVLGDQDEVAVNKQDLHFNVHMHESGDYACQQCVDNARDERN